MNLNYIVISGSSWHKNSVLTPLKDRALEMIVWSQRNEPLHVELHQEGRLMGDRQREETREKKPPPKKAYAKACDAYATGSAAWSNRESAE